MELGICWGEMGKVNYLSLVSSQLFTGVEYLGRRAFVGCWLWLLLLPCALLEHPREYTGTSRTLAFPSKFAGKLLLMQESDRVWGPVSGLINPQGASGSSQRARNRIHKSRQNKLSTLGQENIEKSVGFSLILPWQGPWKCSFLGGIWHPSGFKIKFLFQLTSCQAQQCPGHLRSSSARREVGKLPRDVMSLALVPAGEEMELLGFHLSLSAVQPLSPVQSALEPGRAVALPGFSSLLALRAASIPAGHQGLHLAAFPLCCILVLQTHGVLSVGFLEQSEHGTRWG